MVLIKENCRSSLSFKNEYNIKSHTHTHTHTHTHKKREIELGCESNEHKTNSVNISSN